MAPLTIYLGNKAYSSWSLRPWLALKHTGAPFDEVILQVGGVDTNAILRHVPSGRVPALRHGDLLIWESLAICEYLAEQFPAARLWPEDAAARATARAIASEMHAGFAPLRNALSMNLRRPPAPVAIDDEVRADIDRILAIWTTTRRQHGTAGDFLFGHFTIADAMFAPVVYRFHHYAVPLDGAAADYAAAIRALPAMKQWQAAADAEPWRIEKYEHIQ